ncbi:PREDICTED: calcium-regulated heat stable protein 1-like [Priapulus caudatus]|uniref:Calcium-regulated heat stable protein 1-like n=1 Tax=Priapulus caudatus TaxID=37621 RepID=A0ABM1E8X0_PRICU|nr:PREDICTED: calcium-regulated heat stable protein 1-like [Priapulus caudatus]XP_014668642.1 PREDICTED: calcium-regulated heat stable protein 1-like [Priapulus caudatus]
MTTTEQPHSPCGTPPAAPLPISPLAQPPTSPIRKAFPSLPSPLPTRRTRTQSVSERAAEGPQHKGKVEFFCREKGHGFILPDGGGSHIFVHISDIDGEYIPKHNDIVTYKLCPVPPKMEKLCAVHVTIVHLETHTHERWDSPSPSHKHDDKTP